MDSFVIKQSSLSFITQRLLLIIQEGKANFFLFEYSMSFIELYNFPNTAK